MSSHAVILPEGYVDAKTALLVVAIVGEVVQGKPQGVCLDSKQPFAPLAVCVCHRMTSEVGSRNAGVPDFAGGLFFGWNAL